MAIPLAQRTVSQQAPSVDQTARQSLQLISSIAQPIAESILKTEKLKTNNELSDIQNEITVFNFEYKIKNSLDPYNKESLKKYNDTIQKMYSEKRANIPSQFLGEYDNIFSGFESKNESLMDLWRFQQNQKNVVTDTETGIQRDLNSAYNFGLKGNVFDAINYFDSQESLIQKNIMGLDSQTHKEMFESYKNDFYTNFINGSMNNNPEQTITLLKDERVKNSIAPDTYSELKDAAENKLINARSLAIKKEISSKIMSNTVHTRKAIEGKSNYTELFNYFLENDISKPTREYLLKVGGYAKDKKDIKPALSEQVKLKNKLYNQIGLAVEKGDIQDFERIQTQIYQGMDDNYLTQAEGENMIDTYITPYAEEVQDATDDYSVKRWFEFGLNTGTRGINEFVDDLELPGTKKQREVRRSSVRVGLLDNFTDELNAEIKIDPDVNSVKDLNTLSKTKKTKFLNKVRDNSIKNYAESLDIQTENKSINDIKLNIKHNEINKIRQQNQKTVDDSYKMRKQRTFVAIEESEGKYFGLFPDGTDIEIDKETYNLLK